MERTSFCRLGTKKSQYVAYDETKGWALTELSNDGHFDREPIERSMLHDGYIIYGGIGCRESEVEGGGRCGAVLSDSWWSKDCGVIGSGLVRCEGGYGGGGGQGRERELAVDGDRSGGPSKAEGQKG